MYWEHRARACCKAGLCRDRVPEVPLTVGRAGGSGRCVLGRQVVTEWVWDAKDEGSGRGEPGPQTLPWDPSDDGFPICKMDPRPEVAYSTSLQAGVPLEETWDCRDPLQASGPQHQLTPLRHGPGP